ncbi:hypothetical protein D3C81_2172220 [compost metagenome]
MSDSKQTTPVTVAPAPAQRQRCEVWTRVMGYHRPVSSFNIGKQGEHAQRRFFSEAACADHLAQAA